MNNRLKVLSAVRAAGGLAITACFFCSPVLAELSLEQQQRLAQRFRPFIKTTLDGGRDEPFHPVSWQWLIAHSDLYSARSPTSYTPVVTGETMNADHLQLILPSNAANISIAGAAADDPGLTLHLKSTDDRAGESWTSVIHGGNGIYAHVEQIKDTNLINLEYTIVWSYNAAIGSQHDGDITTMILVYDADADLLTRVTYMMHGCVLESFRIANPQSIGFRLLHGQNENGQLADVLVAQISVTESYQGATTCTDGCPNGDCHSPSDTHVYLAQDPKTFLFEHPVLYAEEGSHEPWPNVSGSIWTVPAHDGSGVSFLPDRVEVLGTPTAPNPTDYPFIFYNGKFGTDPQAILLHRAWYWPEGRANNPFGIPDGRFADNPDPYVTHGALSWPPQAEYLNSPATMFMAQRQIYATYVTGTEFDGSSARPFPNLSTAASFAPKNATLAISSGTYSGPAVLSRAATFVAKDGPVLLGGK